MTSSQTSKKNYFESNQVPLMNSVRYNSLGKKDAATRFMENIDINELKKQVQQEKAESDDPDKALITLNAEIRKLIKAKCDEALANLSDADAKRLKVIQLEHSFLHSHGYRILVSIFFSFLTVFRLQ